MTDKEEIKFAIRYLKKGLKSKRTPPLYEELMNELGFVSEKELGKLEGFLEDEKMEYIELENLKNNEIAELKAILHCTKETCDNCGFVSCENFQRQRKSTPCNVYISYKDRITKMKLQLNEAKEIIEKLSTCFSSYSSNIFEMELLAEAEKFLKE